MLFEALVSDVSEMSVTVPHTTASPHPAPASDTTAESHEVVMFRYRGLYAPIDGAFEQIARMAALVFDAEIVTVNIADDARVWFPAVEGPQGGGLSPAGPSLSASVAAADGPPEPDEHRTTSTTPMPAGPYAVDDTARDSRTGDHPWVKGQDRIRFFAAAPIVTPDGLRIGTLEVMDRKRRRRTTSTQLALLGGLSATIAQLLHLRMGALATLRTERDSHAADTLARDSSDQLTAQMSQAATAVRDRQRPQRCQLGGSTACTEHAELKVADSWGEGAWGCWPHAEEALVQIPSVFLATESIPNLSTYRHRIPR
jgi:hypothetical protein